jgi:hydroxymethylpyrimidine pyrophosphatase-like HAD family hydrolase
MIIAVDFDGTIVEHEFPKIGPAVPGAFKSIKKLQESGHRLILWTMRSDGQECGDVLTQAVKFCEDNGIRFWAVNCNPEQHTWTTSNKSYAHLYIDDAALGCPLRENPRLGGRNYVDWDKVMELLFEGQ